MLRVNSIEDSLIDPFEPLMDVDHSEVEDGLLITRKSTPKPLAVEIPPPTPPPIVTTRTGHQLRVPKALQDFIPSSTNGLSMHIPRPTRKPKVAPPPRFPTSDHLAPHLQPESPNPIEYATEPNQFGVFRVCSHIPQ